MKKNYKYVTDAYRNIQGTEPNTSTLVYGFVSPTVSVGAFVSITNGSFIPKETGQFIFSCRADDHGAIYLSTSPLSGDPDLDKDYLICQRDYYASNHD